MFLYILNQLYNYWVNGLLFSDIDFLNENNPKQNANNKEIDKLPNKLELIFV